MIPFIDLAAIKPTPGTTPASGIDLSLTNLVNFKKPEVSPTVTQNQLKTQPEVTSPDFNVGEYLVKMQENFNKMLEANQPILSATVSTQQALEKAQEKSASSINSTTNYISGKLEKLEKSRADYMKEKGESQNATQLKDESFRNLNRWMSDFYAVARIALKDNPQLLEALSKTIKN